MEFQGLSPAGLPMTPREAAALAPPQLAYVGDAVYELIVRSVLVATGAPVDELHNRAIGWVSAAGQERVWSKIKGKLTPAEAAVARRGRNAKTSAPKGTAVRTYRTSTSMEALIGYLYLTGEIGRIRELLDPVLNLEGDEGKEDEPGEAH